MNVKIIDGYLHVGENMVSASYKLFTKEGIDICMPKEKETDRRPCDKCRQWHDPDLICHQPDHGAPSGQSYGRVATIGDVYIMVDRLVSNLARRLDALNQTVSSNYALHALATELRLETENWK